MATLVRPLKTASGPKTSMNFVEGRVYQTDGPSAKRLIDYGFAEEVDRTELANNVPVDELPMITNVPTLKRDQIGPTIPVDVSHSELLDTVMKLREEVAALKAGRK